MGCWGGGSGVGGGVEGAGGWRGWLDCEPQPCGTDLRPGYHRHGAGPRVSPTLQPQRGHGTQRGGTSSPGTGCPPATGTHWDQSDLRWARSGGKQREPCAGGVPQRGGWVWGGRSVPELCRGGQCSRRIQCQGGRCSLAWGIRTRGGGRVPGGWVQSSPNGAGPGWVGAARSQGKASRGGACPGGSVHPGAGRGCRCTPFPGVIPSWGYQCGPVSRDRVPGTGDPVPGRGRCRCRRSRGLRSSGGRRSRGPGGSLSRSRVGSLRPVGAPGPPRVGPGGAGPGAGHMRSGPASGAIKAGAEGAGRVQS